ncbi:MAG: hypothetical protein OEM96_07865, partial [Gemmatimonadota bacterium]|nr:hypothetical protein [Gemmatimonadota bacterium]
SALGGVFLFVSAACFIAVMLGTGLAGKKGYEESIEFAEPLEPPGDRARILDKMWLWVAIGVVLVMAAYAVPILQHSQMNTFGSTGIRLF